MKRGPGASNVDPGHARAPGGRAAQRAAQTGARNVDLGRRAWPRGHGRASICGSAVRAASSAALAARTVTSDHLRQPKRARRRGRGIRTHVIDTAGRASPARHGAGRVSLATWVTSSTCSPSGCRVNAGMGRRGAIHSSRSWPTGPSTTPTRGCCSCATTPCSPRSCTRFRSPCATKEPCSRAV